MVTSANSKNRGRARQVGPFLVLIGILVLGAAFRFYNVNWDKGTYHIHPDERNTAMVITAIDWPSSLAGYFDTSHSPLNPRNRDMAFFYGTLPLFLTKWVGTFVGQTGYDQIHLVGRVLSALFDLGSVLLLFFLGRRLFDWRVGLVSSFLLAVAVLNIQGSHYFAADTFLTFFVVLTIWFTLDVADGPKATGGKGWLAFVALGVSMGLTLACKVSVFLLVVVVLLAAWLRIRRQCLAGHGSIRALLGTTGGLILAGVVALGVFRVAQPYAWAGPNYNAWDSVPEPWGERMRVFEKVPEPIRAVIMPNPQWIADIVSAGAQQTGEADLPWGRQWTERAPWLYPLENMVLWGLGVPLGIAAWLGVGLTVLESLRAWRRRRGGGSGSDEFGIRESGNSAVAAGNWDLVLIPLTWVVLTFLWQGMQFVKSIRYFLPIYPFLAMFAAHLVIAAWDWARGLPSAPEPSGGTGGQRWLAKAAAGTLAAVVLLGTLAWAWAFIQIYREPVTRVQATRWMYENIETGATLRYHTADGRSGQIQIPVPSTYVYDENGRWLPTPFVPPEDLIATEVVMNGLAAADGVDGPSNSTFEVQITANDGDPAVLTGAQIEAEFGGTGGQPSGVTGSRRYVLDLPDVSLHSGESYSLQTRVLSGASLISSGAAIANEHFDDPLPFNMDGHLAFGAGPYRGLDLTLYDEDTPEKLEQLLDVLDEADYISMSSGRLYNSIPRLPMRYPVTTRYYELLFAEKLGFEKVVEFHSYPRLQAPAALAGIGIEFNDDRAEEQFTVYDHPKVLIYRKTAEYDRERVGALLSEGIDWDNIPHWLNPRDVGEWKRTHQNQNMLMLTEAQRQVQEQGGTWASIFQRNSLPNRWPTLSWLLLMAVVGLAALPLTVAVLGRLPDGGYILARPIGVVLLGWLSWMLTNLTPLGYTRGTITLALGAIAALSAAVLLLPGPRDRLLELWRTRKGVLLANELLFLAFFALFWLIRWGNPDLWHAWKGGEKPMDLAYLNAVIKSTKFPPYDPWFAGGYLNYYYFGQVLVGTLIKLIGIVPAVAYNLVIPTWFAMTAMGAFSATYNLVAGKPTERSAGSGSSLGSLRPLFFGLVGALFVALLGNLGEIHLLLLKLGEGVMGSFKSTLPGLAALVRAAIGSAEVIFGGRALPVGIDEWYWSASRAIPSGPFESVITEFPFFTFLYADLHAHLIALPLSFISLATALAVVHSEESGTPQRADRMLRSGWAGVVQQLPPLLLWALTLGALRTTNTWDVPPHLLLVFGALSIAEYARRGRLSWRGVGAVTWQFALVFVLSWWVLYRPFWTHYGSFYNSIGLWSGTRTVLWAYLVVHGLFLFLLVSYLCARVIGEWRQVPLLRRLSLTLRYRGSKRRLRAVAQIMGVRGVPVSGLVWVALGLLLVLGLLFVVPGLLPSSTPKVEAGATDAYAYRGLAAFALGLPVAVLGLLLLLRPGLPPSERLWSYLVLLGLAMTLGVEVIVIQGDIGRMNTVFKFYLQVWLFWGVAAAAGLGWLLPRLWRWDQGRGLWLGILVVLLLCAALYPPLATAAKVRDRFDPKQGPGLDGWAYMKTAHYFDPNGPDYDLKWDLEAIQWLLDNVVGSPTLLEGHTPEYRWGGRYSINTGLPAVLGWNWHQRQQRAAAGDQAVWDRADDVATIYNTASVEMAQSLLSKYGVQYIIVGPLERGYYDSAGLAKFEQMVADGRLRRAFQNQEVAIYEVGAGP